jgi:hypothetical protein
MGNSEESKIRQSGPGEEHPATRPEATNPETLSEIEEEEEIENTESGTRDELPSPDGPLDEPSRVRDDDAGPM